MKVSRNEFFKLLGGGAAIATTLPAKLPPIDPAIEKANHAVIQTIERIGNPTNFDVHPGILYSRFDTDDFIERHNVPLFVRGMMQYHNGMASTNMLQGSTMCAPEIFAIGSISIIADRTATQKQLERFEKHMVGELFVGNKKFIDVPISRILASASLDELVDREGNPKNLMSSKSFRVDPPLVLDYNWSFKYELRIGYGAYATRTSYKPEFGGYVLLDGHRAWGVQ